MAKTILRMARAGRRRGKFTDTFILYEPNFTMLDVPNGVEDASILVCAKVGELRISVVSWTMEPDDGKRPRRTGEVCKVYVINSKVHVDSAG